MVGQRLSDHPDIRKLGFTGSTPIGKQIMKRYDQTNSANCSSVDVTVRWNFMPFVPPCCSCAVSNLKKVSLELGGKSPLIIFSDCDMDKAVRMVRERHWQGESDVWAYWRIIRLLLHRVISAKAVSHWVHFSIDRKFTSYHVLFVHGVLCRIYWLVVANTSFKVSPSFMAQWSRQRERDQQWLCELENEWTEGATLAGSYTPLSKGDPEMSKPLQNIMNIIKYRQGKDILPTHF